MRISALAAMTLALSCIAGPAHAQSPGDRDAVERQVLAALNAVRADPQAFAQSLQVFRGYFHANYYKLPGSRADNQTEEGVRAVDEAIGFLARQQSLAPIEAAPVLADAASEHSAEQAADGNTGHEGADGSNPGDRVRRHGGGAYVAEVIEYGASDAVDAIRQFIVDDGVADRGHRGILFDPRLRYAGVSCGPHPEFRTMCVIDFGVTPDGHAPGGLRVAVADLRHDARPSS